jgi:hypothetical protein
MQITLDKKHYIYSIKKLKRIEKLSFQVFYIGFVWKNTQKIFTKTLSLLSKKQYEYQKY